MIALVLAAALSVQPEWTEVFNHHGVKGVIVVRDIESGRVTTNDPERAARRFPPASSFKILNSLIILEARAIANENTVVKWDGVDRGNSAWNRDMSLRAAMRASAAWVYQRLARRVGRARMQEWLTRVGYGNAMVGDKVDTFWLRGPLLVSALEQAEFAARLYREDLPFSPRTIKTVKSMMPREGPLHAKTGWAADFQPQIGWYVGYAAIDGRAYAFALNIDIQRNADAPKRIAIVKELLVTPLLRGPS